jgi:regulator of protease activity HflC (stomatin/prohibitin superfamily)
MLTGREDECMRMLEELVAEVPDLLEPHVTLTRLYYKRKRPEDAERHRAIVDRIRKEREADLREQEAKLEKKTPQ